MAVIAVFGSSTVHPGEVAYQEAENLGGALGGAGHSVVSGGYGGIMEAVSRGAGAAGAEVIGITAPPVFPSRSGVNSFVTREVPAGSISERIHRLVDLPDAYVVLGGSIGTLTELMVAWNTAYVAQFSESRSKPIVAVGSQWRELVLHLARTLRTEPSFVTLVDHVDEVLPEIERRWEA